MSACIQAHLRIQYCRLSKCYWNVNEAIAYAVFKNNNALGMHTSKCESEHTLCCLLIPPNKLKEVNYTRNNTNNRNNDDDDDDDNDDNPNGMCFFPRRADNKFHMCFSPRKADNKFHMCFFPRRADNKFHMCFFPRRADNKFHINKLRWSERPSILPTTCRRSHRYSSSDSFTACFTNSLVSHTTCCTQVQGVLLIHKMNTASRCMLLGRWPAKCYP